MVRKLKVKESAERLRPVRKSRRTVKEGFAPTNSGEIYVENVNANEVAQEFADYANDILNGGYGTCWFTLGDDDENEYRIVIGGDERGISMKWAYISKNSAMDDYEVDHFMPYDEDSGDVWDSETLIREEGDTTPVTPDELLSDIKYMLDDFKRFVDEHNAAEEGFDDYDESVSRRVRRGRRMSEARYELSPQHDARKSFYGKAHVVTDDDGTQILYSYNTPVIELKDGKVKLLPMWDSSQTTLRHVKEFLKQNGFSAGSKGEIARLYGESLRRSSRRTASESIAKKNITRRNLKKKTIR